jgi:hypothetical protein
MTCSDFGEKYLPYIYGELEPAETGALHSHIESCEVCRRRLDEVKSLLDQVSAMKPPALPFERASELKSKIAARAFSEPARREAAASRYYHRSFALVAAGVLILVAAVAAIIGMPQSLSDPTGIPLPTATTVPAQEVAYVLPENSEGKRYANVVEYSKWVSSTWAECSAASCDPVEMLDNQISRVDEMIASLE